MLTTENTLFLLVDVQGKLAHIVHESASTIQNIQALVKGMNLFKIPILSVEQNPNGLGKTVEEISTLIQDFNPYSKMTFSAWSEPTIQAEINRINPRNIVVVGIETHVCVYQTCVELLEENYHVVLVQDAVSSRTQANKELAINKLSLLGAEITSTEMLLFELQKTCAHPRFKELLTLIK